MAAAATAKAFLVVYHQARPKLGQENCFGKLPKIHSDNFALPQPYIVPLATVAARTLHSVVSLPQV